MATATLTRGYGYWIQSNGLYNNKEDYIDDWTWYIGQWRQDYWAQSEYGACCVEYHVPVIEDRLLSRTITIPITFYGNTGMCEVFAVLSTKAPDDSLDFRYGPTGGVISDVQKTVYEDRDNTVFSFTVDNSISLSGKTIYLYMYHPNQGFGPNGPNSSIVTKTFSNGTLTYSAPYSLTVNAGKGSTITVDRTSSSAGQTGQLSSGAYLYYGDKLKITFAANANYRLLTTTVNNASFISGNSHTVSDNVSISSTAQVLASSVGATDANIGSTSTIVVTKYNTNYYHSLQYSFGNLSGYITSSGGIQSAEVKFQNASVAFSVPVSFYRQIPTERSGVCTITCRTYETSSSTTVLGSATTCTFTATAPKSSCSPVVTAVIEDTNSVTCTLTGNKSTLVQHRSTARCEIMAAERYGARIESLSIDGKAVTGVESTDGQTGTAVFTNVSKTSFDFSATDSRGYTTTLTVRPDIIPYIILTCNPKVTRPTPTGASMSIQASGNYFRGSFGAYSNTLKLQYRYRESGGSYGSWVTIDSANLTIGTTSYRTNGSIILDDEFDYQKSYDFQVRAMDGIDGCTLTTAQSTLSVQKGVPLFDWGENDFNVNGDLRMSNVSLLEIIYPIGSVYMSVESRLPQALTSNGMSWDPLPNVGNMYCWVRVKTLSPPIQA